VNTLDMSTPAIGSGSYLSRAQPIGRFAYPLRSSFNAGMPTLTRKRVNDRPETCTFNVPVRAAKLRSTITILVCWLLISPAVF